MIPDAAASPDRRSRVGQTGTRHGHTGGKLNSLQRLQKHFQILGVAGARGKYDRPYGGVRIIDIEDLLALPDLEAGLIETAPRADGVKF